MAIIIYTYSNPYKINKEPYWAMIKNSFHLCVSQTLVNGLSDQYKEFYNGKLTTINRFINNLYNNWESDETAIKQRAIIDNLIEYMSFQDIVEDILPEDVVRSLKRNRGYVLDSIRIMIELGMDPKNIKKTALTYEQKCVVSIYEELINTNNKAFQLKSDLTNEEIEDAIDDTVAELLQGNDTHNKADQIKKETIVVHGIHQFSPIILRTIENLSRFKNVIILFNYQEDYKNLYQTWLNVYSWFESKIQISSQNFNNDSQAFEGGKIADNMAAMISGNTSTIDFTHLIDVIEFDNQTEFAGYIARKFEAAESKRAKNGFLHTALFYMEEQIYSANSKVNEVLKIYFPEQFGERNFLEYPIGHFFISITNMWSPEIKSMCITDIKDVYECLMCGVIEEDNVGLLVSIFDKCQLYFSHETTLIGIIKKLKRLKRRIENIGDDHQEKEELKRVVYYDVSIREIDILIKALSELNSITEQFFIDFNNQQNDFKSFYKKISEVLKSKILEKEDLDDDFKDIVQRVLLRLNEVEHIEASASFDCLRETMQIYLHQNPKAGKGANWIVRNFEQIDGDVLRKNYKEQEKVYHFACLSDQDMSIAHRDEFPWPLNIEFFEIAQAPVDWKYQVYVTSRMEYKNFRRYALVYGLAFSKCKIKLSYIKNENSNERELYYLLKILGANVRQYEPDYIEGYKKNGNFINIKLPIYKEFSQYDLMKYRLCSYRFLLESVIEGSSVYKDEFLMKLYVNIVLEHRARRYFSGKSYVKNVVYSYLVDELESLSRDFPFMNQLNLVDTVSSAADYIEKQAVNNGKFTKLKNKEFDYMIKRENFLYVPIGKRANDNDKEIFKNATQLEVDNTLTDENLSKDKYYRKLNTLCEKCTEKDICLEVFRIKKK